MSCPILWTPRFYRLSTFVDTALLPSVHFCGHRAFTVCPILRTFSIHGNAKFQYIGICNGAVLRVNNGLLPNIIAFTLNFSLCSRCIIPVYWNLQWRNFLIKRGKIALLPSVTAKTCCTSFPARAERAEFSRPSLLRLNTTRREKKGKPSLKQAELANGGVFP